MKGMGLPVLRILGTHLDSYTLKQRMMCLSRGRDGTDHASTRSQRVMMCCIGTSHNMNYLFILAGICNYDLLKFSHYLM